MAPKKSTASKPRQPRKQVVLDSVEEVQVEAVRRITADPLPLRAGEWQGNTAACEPAAAAAASSPASAAVHLAPFAAQAVCAEGGWTGSTETPPAKKAKKAGKRITLDSLPGFAELASAGKDTSAHTTARREKPVRAAVILARHMQGPKKNTLSGRAFYAVNCIYEENEKLGELFEKVLHQKPKWFKDWGKWAAPCQLAPKALALHELIKKELPQTGRRINGVLDVTPYDNPAIEKLKFTLAASELQFETRADGILPRSIMVCATHVVSHTISPCFQRLQP